MVNEFFQKLWQISSIMPGMELQAAEKIVKNQIELFTNRMSGHNDSIVWTNMLMPTEMFYALGLYPIHTELVAGWFATLNMAQKYIKKSYIKGYHVGLCSYHKVIIGAMEEGVIRPPKMAVMSSHICDGGPLLARYFKERFSTNVKIINIPYYDNEQNRKYVMKQLTDVRQWLECLLGRKISHGEEEKVIEHSNQLRKHMILANDLRKEKLLFLGNLAIRNMFGLTFLSGSELGSEIARTYYHELKEKKAMTADYKRILWIHFAPLYAGRMMHYFEQELKCSIAFDITGHIHWEKYGSNLIEGMTKRLLSHFYLGDSKHRIEFYKNIIHNYHIDAMVMFMHGGCRAIPCSSWELKELSNGEKIPFLELYGDCIDSDNFSTEQMRLRMEAFSERLGN